MAVKRLISFLIAVVVVAVVVVVVVHKEHCSSSCGTQRIRPPFRLKGDRHSCGDPDFELTCSSDNRTMMEFLGGGTYYITDISYVFNTVQMVDLNLASGLCSLPFPFHFLLLASSRWQFTDWTPPGCLSFVNCSEEIQSNESYHLAPCLSGSNSSSFVYFLNSCYARSLLPSCAFLSMVPVNLPDRMISEADAFQLLMKGFSLTWRDKFTTPQKIWICLVQAHRDSIRYLNSIKTVFKWYLYPFIYVIDFSACMNMHSYFADSWYFLSIITAIAVQVVPILIRFMAAPLCIFVFLCYECWKFLKVPIDRIEKFLLKQQTLTSTRYNYSDIIFMTHNFKEKLGQGGFGSVFKGELPGGYLVAVKMLSCFTSNGEDFMNEVSTIGRIHHHNVVQLVGFCSEGSNRALVYEFMPNGSLDKYIFSSDKRHQHFGTEKLNEIALGVARGIDYLHQGCDMRILHFDIKPQNVLLDHNFNAKVSDFGLSKLYPKDYSLISVSVARGTIGYIAPELVSRSFGAISHKSDVYSFGMLLMEMAGGRRNVNNQAENSSQVYYPSWIYDHLHQLELEGPESCIAIEIDDMERKLCKVGLWCIQMRPSERPSMSQVVEMLEDGVDALPMPPKPFFSHAEAFSTKQSSLHSYSEFSVISEDTEEDE